MMKNVLFLLLFCCGILSGGDFYTVVTEKDAPPPIRLAAKELAEYLKKTTGQEVSVQQSVPKGKKSVFELKIIPEKELGDEGYRLNISPEMTIISANTPRGVLYGAYVFIEEFLGVRWFAPGEEYEYCPKNVTLKLPRSNRASTPDFSHREVGYVYAGWKKPTLKTYEWLTRNRMQITFGRMPEGKADFIKERDGAWKRGGHVLCNIVPDSLLAEKPELFALVDGKRIPQREGEKWISNPCLTNPEVIRRTVDFIEQFYQNRPVEKTQFHLGNNDVAEWCQCPSCKALDTAEELKNGSITSRWVTFVNTVAREVHKKYPQVKITTWAYQNYRIPSSRIKVNGDVLVGFCPHGRCYRHPINDPVCSTNQWYRTQQEQWAKDGAQVYDRGYQEILLKEDDYYYIPIEKVIAEDLKYYKKIGLKGTEYVLAPPDGDYDHPVAKPFLPAVGKQWNCLWPSLWIASKMLWNADSDYEALYEDMGAKFYGPAWPAMKQFREILRSSVMNSTGHTTYGTPGITLVDCVNEKTYQELQKLFQQALELAKNDTAVTKRLQEERIYFEGLWGKVAKAGAISGKETAAAKADPDMVIDGAFEEPAWGKVDAESNFIVRNSDNRKAKHQTYVKMLYDDENLYFSILAVEPEMSKLCTSVTKNGGPVWSDSCLEFYIGDGKGGYWQYLVNPNNAVTSIRYDAEEAAKNAAAANSQIGYRNFDGKVDVKTVKREKSYLQEIRIPLAPTGIRVKSGMSLPVNITRMRKVDAPDGRELSSWSGGVWNTPAGFRKVTLGKSLLRNGTFGLIKAYKGDVVTVKNPEKWVEFWGADGSSARWVPSPKDAHVELLNGRIYTFFYPLRGKKSWMVSGEIRASGKGILKAYFSLNKHSRKIPIGEFPLSGKCMSYTLLPAELSPSDEGYLYVDVRGGEAKIESVNVVVEPSKTEEIKK